MDILSLNNEMVCPTSNVRIVVHVIDTGINIVGPLIGRAEIVRYADTQDTSGLLGGGKRTYDYSDMWPGVGHGTGVSYLAGLGVPNVYVRSYNTFASVANAVQRCLGAVLQYVQEHPEERHIVNMSFSTSYSSEQHSLIQQLVSLNVAVVAAAGNDGSEVLDKYPSYYEEPITVAALKPDGTKALFSTWHNEVDFAELGVDIPALTKDGEIKDMSGTSFAAPTLCNKLAKMWCGNPALTEPELYEAAKKNCLDLGTGGRDPYFGYGWIQNIEVAPPEAVEPPVEPEEPIDPEEPIPPEEPENPKEENAVAKIIVKNLIYDMDVAKLQIALNALGYPCGAADGKAGDKTMAAIATFVTAHSVPIESPEPEPLPETLTLAIEISGKRYGIEIKEVE